MAVFAEVPPPVRRPGAAARLIARAARAGAAGCYAWLAYTLVHLALSGRWWPMLLADLAPPLVFVAAPVSVAALAAADRRLRRLPLLAAALALALGWEGAGIDVGALGALGAQRPLRPGAVHVVSWNTQYWDQDDDAGRFYAYLRSYDADVYLLQEYLHWRGDRPARVDDTARLRQEFPGYSIVSSGELLTLTRLPVVGSRELDSFPWFSSVPAGSSFPQFWRYKTLRTDVQVSGRILSLYNVHVPVQLDTSHGILTPAFLGAVHDQSRRRDAAWSALSGDLAGNAGPRLVLGDLNTTPAMGELSRLDRLLAPARPTGGELYPTSWYARRLPLWRLDFAYHDAATEIDRYGFRDGGGFSDHDAQDLWVSVQEGRTT